MSMNHKDYARKVKEEHAYPEILIMANSQSAAGSLSASESMKSGVFNRDTEPDADPEGILTAKMGIGDATRIDLDLH